MEIEFCLSIISRTPHMDSANWSLGSLPQFAISKQNCDQSNRTMGISVAKFPFAFPFPFPHHGHLFMSVCNHWRNPRLWSSTSSFLFCHHKKVFTRNFQADPSSCVGTFPCHYRLPLFVQRWQIQPSSEDCDQVSLHQWRSTIFDKPIEYLLFLTLVCPMCAGNNYQSQLC